MWKAEFSPLMLTGTTYAPAAGGVVTLTGTDFLPGSSVTVDGVPATDVVVSGLQQLTARVAAHATGAASIKLTTPEGRNVTSSTTLVFDGIAPTGTVQINANAPITASQSVTLTLAASDEASAVASMAFSNDGTTFSAFEPFLTTKAWTLSDSDGQRTVYARFRDGVGNVSATVSDDVLLDRRPPVGTVQINANAPITASQSVMLTLAASDETSGVAAMAFSNDGTTFTPFEPYATSRAWTLVNSDGTRTVYVRFRDVAGNVSANVTAQIVLERPPPTGSVGVNSPAISTISREVYARVSAAPATAASVVDDVSFSFDGASWDAWRTYSPADFYPLLLPSGDGLKTVYARFRDSGGSVSSGVTDSIYLDTAVAVNTVSINAGAVYTNSENVTLRLGAGGPGSTEMLISNDGGFVGAVWEPYASRRSWALSGAGPTIGPNITTRVVYVRYFRVQNGPALRAASVTAAPPSTPPAWSSMTISDACAPGSRTGHDPYAAWEPLISKDGAFELVTTADRIELRFCAPILSAHLVQNRERHPLAIGASIDGAAGMFSWEPGPAFLGEFEFIFELAGASADLPNPIRG